ncbi:MAG TPA: DUF2760 domain-containing protein [Pirellulaceae bacterium]|nr:DUF2760 domain-containing protein [Pirellulaceae bacterium]
MGSIGIAFRAFFKTLFNRAAADQVAAVLDGRTLPKLTTEENQTQRPPEAKPAPAAPKRSDAVTLLAALQREARLVDLIQEDLSAYSDEQVGAAARNVLRDSAAVLSRFFALKRIASGSEGEPIDVPAGYDPGRFQLVGTVSGTPPYRGTLTHAGWQATTVNLPTWSGSKDASLVIALAEVEVPEDSQE